MLYHVRAALTRIRELFRHRSRFAAEQRSRAGVARPHAAVAPEDACRHRQRMDDVVPALLLEANRWHRQFSHHGSSDRHPRKPVLCTDFNPPERRAPYLVPGSRIVPATVTIASQERLGGRAGNRRPEAAFLYGAVSRRNE